MARLVTERIIEVLPGETGDWLIQVKSPEGGEPHEIYEHNFDEFWVEED